MGNIVDDINLPGIKMQSGVFISYSSEVVSLGVTLDSKLSWKPHINQIVKKVNKALYSLRFIWALYLKDSLQTVGRGISTTTPGLLCRGILRRDERIVD